MPGRASGLLLGGNLSMLASTLGSDDMPDLTGAILLVEDVEEPHYSIDRMLTSLQRSGALAGAAGVAVGQFTDCVGRPGTWTVGEVLTDRLGALGVPVLGGLPVGHSTGQLTAPLGVPASLDTDAGTLTVEPAVR